MVKLRSAWRLEELGMQRAGRLHDATKVCQACQVEPEHAAACSSQACAHHVRRGEVGALSRADAPERLLLVGEDCLPGGTSRRSFFFCRGAFGPAFRLRPDGGSIK